MTMSVYNSPINRGVITLVKGDDYTAAGDDADPIYTHTPSASLGYVAADVASAVINFFDAQSGEELFSAAGTVIASTATIDGASVNTLKFTATTITDAQTDLLRQGYNTARYTVVATLTDGATKTLAKGDVDVE